jgi:hypothetical protein
MARRGAICPPAARTARPGPRGTDRELPRRRPAQTSLAPSAAPRISLKDAASRRTPRERPPSRSRVPAPEAHPSGSVRRKGREERLTGASVPTAEAAIAAADQAPTPAGRGCGAGACLHRASARRSATTCPPSSRAAACPRQPGARERWRGTGLPSWAAPGRSTRRTARRRRDRDTDRAAAPTPRCKRRQAQRPGEACEPTVWADQEEVQGATREGSGSSRPGGPPPAQTNAGRGEAGWRSAHPG